MSDFSRLSSPGDRLSLRDTPHPAPARRVLYPTQGLHFYSAYLIVLAILEAISLSLLFSMLAGCATKPAAVVKDSLTADQTVYSDVVTNRPVRHPERIQPPPTPP